jgi:DNA modification methylase
MSAEIIHGDCLDVMRWRDADTVDAVVTDPPYGLSFMGKHWDHGVPGVAFWTEALRLLKPGARLLAFGGTRTYHRMACAIEDAGFEIEDSLCWLYGSGFPKHKSKLKPAHEPIVMARKPAPRATLLNIDACRIEGEPSGLKPYIRSTTPPGYELGMAKAGRAVTFTDHPSGRWPANVVLDEEAARALDEMSGMLQTGGGIRNGPQTPAFFGRFAGDEDVRSFPGNTGGASRFYYVAKASRSEREAGCASLPKRTFYADAAIPQRDERPNTANANHHPTVKPVALMRWLVRLVTPPDGLVLDPFTGSGTTGIAATLEGRRFLGIEREAEYVEIARARIAHAQPALGVA